MSSPTIRKLLCPHCRALLEYDPEQAGQAADCWACGKAFRVPKPPGTPEEPASSPVATQEEPPEPIEATPEGPTPSEPASTIPLPPPIPLELLKQESPLGDDLTLDSAPPRDSELPPRGRRRQGLDSDESRSGRDSRRLRRSRDRLTDPAEVKKRAWLQTGAGLGLVQLGWFGLTAGFWLWFLLLLSGVWSDRIVGQQAIPLLQWMRESTLSSLVVLPAFFMIVGYVLVCIGQILCLWVPIRSAKQACVASICLWMCLFLLFAIASGVSLTAPTGGGGVASPTRTLFGWTITLLGISVVSQLLYLSAIWQLGSSLENKKVPKMCWISLAISLAWSVMLVILFLPGQMARGLAILDGLTASKTPGVLAGLGWVVILLSSVNFFIFQWILSKSRALIRAETSEDADSKEEAESPEMSARSP